MIHQSGLAVGLDYTYLPPILESNKHLLGIDSDRMLVDTKLKVGYSLDKEDSCGVGVDLDIKTKESFEPVAFSMIFGKQFLPS